jgi:predicted flap endonuclease-1-like 5' DNA nuclease
MLALISQMLLCLLAAAVVGFAVAWVLRTGQVAELTSEVERLRALVPTGVLPSALSTRLELLARMMEEVKARPATEAAATELHRLLEAQQALQGTVSELARRPAPATPTVDLTPIVQKLETLSGSGELSSRLASVTTTLAALRPPELSAMEQRVDALADRVDALVTRTREVDLSPVQQRLDGLVAALDELRSRPALAVDLGPLHASQERAIEGLQASLATLADPSPIERRLDRLAQELAALRPRLAPPAPTRSRAPRPPKEEWDDLILIHGVGPVLQRLLHRMGIYRFDQVMSWDPNDIAAVTARLPSFKGRIEREGWVESARREYEKKYGHRSSEATAHSH